MSESEGILFLSDALNNNFFLYHDIAQEIIGPYWEHMMTDTLVTYNDPVNFAQWEVHGM